MSLRFILIFTKEFFKRFKGLILLGFLSGVVIFLIFRLILPKISTTTEKIGISGKYTPTEMPGDILSLISDGLTKLDEQGNVTPALAESWSSEDGGRTWTFKLKADTRWHDGNRLDSDSITYEFSDAVIERPDESSIVFKLDTPFAAFPVIVNKPVFKKGLLGTGDWRVKNISLVGGYVNKLTLTNPQGNKKIYTFYPNEERLKLGYKLGEIDVVQDLVDPAPLDSWKTSVVTKNQNNKYFVAVFLNTEKDNLAEKTYRQALAYAITKDNFPGERAISSISPKSWAFNSQVKQYTKDTEKVAELLKDSKDNKIVLSSAANLIQTAESIKKDWEAAGIATEIQIVTGIPEDYQALLATVDIPQDPDQYVLWHSTQTETNISKFKNARIDKLLEDGRTQLSIDERKKIYLDFQRFLAEEIPAIFLYHPVFYTVSRR